ESKGDKVQTDLLAWIGQALTEFDIAGLNLCALVDFVEGTLRNANTVVRYSAISTILAL
ncbi:hypothetical protein CALCODRAFT_440801, partial [Calocera cornea HHB12733]